MGAGDSAVGGDVDIIAGETTAQEAIGGDVTISAGLGSNDNSNNGGDGGRVFISGGEAQGESEAKDFMRYHHSGWSI